MNLLFAYLNAGDKVMSNADARGLMSSIMLCKPVRGILDMVGKNGFPKYACYKKWTTERCVSIVSRNIINGSPSQATGWLEASTLLWNLMGQSHPQITRAAMDLISSKHRAYNQLTNFETIIFSYEVYKYFRTALKCKVTGSISATSHLN